MNTLFRGLLLLRVSQHVIEPGPRLSPMDQSLHAMQFWIVFLIQGHHVSGRLVLDLLPGRGSCSASLWPRALAARAFHRTTCLAILATELPHCDRVQASTSVRSELLVDLLVQVCLAGSCLFGTIVPRNVLRRVRVPTVWILLISAGPSARWACSVVARVRLSDRELRVVDLHLSLAVWALARLAWRG